MTSDYKVHPIKEPLTPIHILGDRKLTPEAVSAVESVLRTELLDAMHKSLADSCIRHG